MDVTVLAKAGVDPHEYELTAGNRRALEDADLVLRNGLGLDSYVDSALEDGDIEKKTVRMEAPGFSAQAISRRRWSDP